MKTFLRIVALATTMLGTVPLASAQVSFGIRIGPPPGPRVVHVRPVSPGRDYIWVDGYWYPVGNHYRWHEGYWTRPPYEGARWIGPRYEGGQFYQGYWGGEHGRIEHDHRWDRDRDRDYRYDRDHHDRDDHHDHDGDHDNR